MQPLPNIEVLTFLNWMDLNGYARNRIGVPLDELFLNDRYQDQVRRLEQEYMRSRTMDSGSEREAYERYVDCFFSELKYYVMKEFDRHPYLPCYHRREKWDEDSGLSPFLEKLKRAACYINWNDLRELEHQLDSSPMGYYYDGYFGESVRFFLQNWKEPVVANFFIRKHDTVAGTTLHFLEWANQRRKLKNTNLRNVPANVIEGYIHDHVWSEYQRIGLSDSEKNKKEALLKRVLIQQEYSHYLENILTTSNAEDYSLERVVQRSFNRAARYKCTLLADDDSFRILVQDYWEEMNTCSGNHLDIYYSEAELAQRGRSTADKLRIRARVTQYPAIYLWEYGLDEGISIPVGGLDSRELMDLFKMITDDIAKGQALTTVVESATQIVGLFLKAKNAAKEQEDAFTRQLLDACTKLQTNENYVRNTDENGRNTYIKHLLESAGYTVNDQTLGGLSPTAKSAGELDLKVYGSDGLPFTILEALNITAAHPCSWNRKNLREHVNKLYAYDSNGLVRNYVIVYATTPEFGRFTEEVQKVIENEKKCPYGEAKLVGVMPFDTGFTDIGMVCAKYLRNGSEIRLYVLCVRMADKKSVP